MMLSELVATIGGLVRTMTANPGLLFVFAPFALFLVLAIWLFKVLVLRRGLIVLGIAGVVGVIVLQQLWNNGSQTLALMFSIVLLFIARSGYTRLVDQTTEEE